MRLNYFTSSWTVSSSPVEVGDFFFLLGTEGEEEEEVHLSEDKRQRIDFYMGEKRVSAPGCLQSNPGIRIWTVSKPVAGER